MIVSWVSFDTQTDRTITDCSLALCLSINNTTPTIIRSEFLSS